MPIEDAHPVALRVLLTAVRVLQEGPPHSIGSSPEGIQEHRQGDLEIVVELTLGHDGIIGGGLGGPYTVSWSAMISSTRPLEPADTVIVWINPKPGAMSTLKAPFNSAIKSA